MKLSAIGSGVTYAVITFAALACSKKETPQTGADTANPAVATAAAKPPKGTLPQGWHNYKSAEFRDSVGAVVWTDSTPGERKCVSAGNCREQAWIAANEDAREITPAVAGANGAVIAWMRLSPTSKKETTMYHLLPGPFTYYTVVTANAAGTGMNWEIIQVADKGDAPLKSIGYGTFHPCGDGKGPVAAADWNGCSSHFMHTGDPKADSAARVKFAAQFADGDGEGWVSCESGCCTLSAPDKGPKPESTKTSTAKQGT